MDRLLSDISYSLRRLQRAPGFAAIALLTLALGIGANTAIFSIIEAVVLRPLPYRDPGRLAVIWSDRDAGETTWLSASEVQAYAQEVRGFEQVAAYTTSAANLTGGPEPERVIVGAVTPNLFQTLGVRPLHGRAFLPDDATASPATVVVLGHGLWQRRFGADPGIVGREIQMNGTARVVVGVLPASFRLPLDFAEDRPTELWTPLSLASPSYRGWGNRSFIGIARLTAGSDFARAGAEMGRAEERWVRERFLNDRDGLQREAVPVQDLVLGNVRTALLVLVGAVGVILLIACANVANLTLARSDDREREIALRTALGASRGRLVRQLLTESVLLSLIGGALGTALAYAGTRMLIAFDPAGIPRVEDVGLDMGVFAFTLALAAGTGLLFGLAPALELSRPDLSRPLREGGRTGTVGRGRQRFRDSLAVAQMAFSVVLLIGAMLLVRSFMGLQRIDLGFDTRNALTFRLTIPQTTYGDAARVVAYFRTILDRMEQLPGVRSVGATRLLPLTGTIGDWSITLEGRERRPGENPNGDWQVVTPGYLETMGVRLVRGRFLTAGDHQEAPLSAVINETMAGRYWPNEDAIGKRFHLGTRDQPWVTVVGIVRQVRHNAIVETPRAEMYMAHAQFSAAGGQIIRAMTFVMRTTGDPLASIGHVRQAVRALDPNVPIADVRTLERVAADSLSQPRFTAVLLGLFAALALTLATVGIYGVISLLVARRRQEIGIRMALGARRSAVLGMVVGRGMVLAAAGVGLGLLGAAAVTRVLSSMLYGVTRFDPLTFAAAPAVLGAVALVACFIPALRAAAVDPAIALRGD